MDWAANQLTSQKNFPSRLTLGNEGPGGNQQGIRVLTNIFRRVYRIFAHAWFQHRQVFWDVEGNKGLYIFFKSVCDIYNLIPQESYTIPSEAEGVAATPTAAKEEEKQDIRPAQDFSQDEAVRSEATTSMSTGATTRRHKHTPSTGSAVTTITEGDEDDKEHHSPDKDVPANIFSSVPLRDSSTVIRQPKSEEVKQTESAVEKEENAEEKSGLDESEVQGEVEETKASGEAPQEAKVEDDQKLDA
ncbi:MAG: hypothetical protein Q9190_005533 [Brigantiaea leucoxantha]